MTNTSIPYEPETSHNRPGDNFLLAPEHAEKLYRRHLQGAYGAF